MAKITLTDQQIISSTVSSPRDTLCIPLAASLLSSSEWSSPHPDIITLPLTPDIITLLQHRFVSSPHASDRSDDDGQLALEPLKLAEDSSKLVAVTAGCYRGRGNYGGRSARNIETELPRLIAG